LNFKKLIKEMSSVEFKQVPPSGVLYNIPPSESDYIVSTRFQEFLSDSTSAYSPGQIVRFTINSADSVLDGRNSFYRFQLNPSFGTSVNSPRLDLGGIHSMINTHRILLSNGTEIERLDSYNKLYAIARRYMLDEDYVKNLEASYSQDSQNDLWYRQDSFEYPGVDYAASTYTATTGVVAALLATSDAREYIDVGDYVEIVGTTAGDGGSGLVVDVGAATFTIDCVGAAGMNIAAGAFSRIIVWKKYKSERSIITNQQGLNQYGATLANAGFSLTNSAINVMFRPFSDFWNNSKMIPLMFMRNLTFEITLEYPNLCFYQESAIAGYANAAAANYFTYTVSNCRMIACLRQPSESMKNMLLNMYNSPQGIPIAFNSFWHNTNTITSTGSVQLVIPVRVKSARGVVSAWYYPYSESNEQLAQQYKSISTTPKNGTTGYQYIIGSQRFPAYAEVNTEGVLNGEALHHALSVQNALGVPNHPSSLNRYDYNATNTFPAGSYATSGAVRTKNESKAFIMAINTSSSDCMSCGQDLTSNQLQLQISRTSGYNGSNVLRSWVLHDRLLLISSANTVVIY
jgi:hypothetical protein